MDNIKFGADGWNALIADSYTVGNVARIARASARWLINREKDKDPSVIIGYDTRFGGKMFAEATAKVFALTGVKVYLSDRFVSTPMVSLGVIKENASMGVIITASHKSYPYNGFKLRGHHGGPLLDNELKNIEDMITVLNEINLESLYFDDFIEKGIIEYIDIAEMFFTHIRENFDVDSLIKSKFSFAFDAMYGSCQQIIKKLLPEVNLIHCNQDYAFGGVSPDPVESNLTEFSAFIKRNGKVDCGLAVDGDADRVALFDGYGNYIDSHHIVLLLIHYLHKYKGYRGKVVIGLALSVKIEKLCHYYGIDIQRVKTGFKEIFNIIIKEKVLIGGEESGGISIPSHIPERDGIWIGLLIWQFMVETGRSVNELIEEVYSITGSFATKRIDLHLDKNTINSIIDRCKNDSIRMFGNRNVQRFEYIDGFRFFFNDDEWVMIRASDREPVLIIYAESYNPESALEILNDVMELLNCQAKP